ncbi:MAG: aminotransferase class I/II-fold pyridoxal phosphate-dependent enzyme [Deltaproteobacteria bacterium]|nr:aminotransferase class I/II-fold pyridoxal phosphate-dependent enzyme [Deltaproteobacteria bacterium]
MDPLAVAAAAPPLDPDPAVRAAWMEALAAFVERQLGALDSASADGLPPDEARAVLAAAPRGVPATPLSLPDALAHLERLAAVGLQTNGPGYLAYVPGGGLFAAAVASFAALVMNRFTGLAQASPGLARLEHDVVDLLCREAGLPATAGGVLASGGSIANLSAVVAARVARFGDAGDLSRATLYTSTQTHRSVVKAARLAGIPPANARLIAVDGALRMDVAALARALDDDRARGLEPFLVVAAGGTTNTGAIDPLGPIADLCRDRGLWLHVDAAYGGCFLLTREGKQKLAGVERADSITLDPHKGFFLPYGCGCLLVRDAATLVRSHADRGSYLQDLGDDDGTRSAADHGPELSRNDRGVLLWLPFALHGLDAFRAALDDKLALARRLRAALVHPDIEVPVEPELSIVAFRPRRRAGEPLAEWNARAVAWLERINRRGRVHLSSTRLAVRDGEVTTLRACVLSFRTDAARIEAAIADVLGTLDDNVK